jgi:hypothetical protein
LLHDPATNKNKQRGYDRVETWQFFVRDSVELVTWRRHRSGATTASRSTNT